MPQEELGYVELEWTCQNCGTRNPGTRKNCVSCGAAMDAKTKFELPAQQELIEDAGKLSAAAAAPDIACPYCGTRNPSTATSCKQCGGDLKGGQAREAGGVLGAFDATKQPDVKCPSCGTLNPAGAFKCSNCGASLKRAPEPAPAAQTSVPTRGISPLMIAGIVAVLLLCAAGAYFLFFRTSDTVGTVAGTSWQRTIAIMALTPVRGADWQDRIPTDATVLGCELKPRRMSQVEEPNSVKVCGTPYVLDQGTGAGKVVQDCQYQVSEEYCSFTRMQWTVINTVAARGTDLQPNWPLYSLATGEREGNRAEEYRVIFDGGGQQYTYTPNTVNEYTQFRPGSRWLLKVNGLGNIIETTPAQ
ncbi:MAG: zinc ribbon domain-containing protein [Anaerolineae bacterium]|nr:zinc ribbon domain-containing protein [Anaerolineae bacterium]